MIKKRELGLKFYISKKLRKVANYEASKRAVIRFCLDILKREVENHKYILSSDIDVWAEKAAPIDGHLLSDIEVGFILNYILPLGRRSKKNLILTETQLKTVSELLERKIKNVYPPAIK